MYSRYGWDKTCNFVNLLSYFHVSRQIQERNFHRLIIISWFNALAVVGLFAGLWRGPFLKGPLPAETPSESRPLEAPSGYQGTWKKPSHRMHAIESFSSPRPTRAGRRRAGRENVPRRVRSGLWNWRRSPDWMALRAQQVFKDVWLKQLRI